MNPSSGFDIDDELINAPYYHGFQTRMEADALLRPVDGSFLVRLVQVDAELIYVVSVYWKKIKHHYRIYRSKNGKSFFLNKIKAPTIPSLIRLHRFTKTPVNLESRARLDRCVERTHYALYREQLTIKEIVGHGEFGEVRRGKLKMGIWTNADVAVKMMVHDSTRISSSERIKFLREANLMMRLRHPNIVRLYGVVIYDDPILIVTEFAEGGCMLTRLQGTVLSRQQKLNFCRDICFGMAYLERQNVIHRDLAARNCLLSKSSRVKISDFGLSLIGDAAVTIVKSGRAPIRYCPPETLRKAIFSHKTDVWSYGVVLFEIWSNGEEPYANIKDNKELRNKVVHENLRLQPPKNMPKQMRNLMRLTHLEDPSKRPTFERISLKWFGGEEQSLVEKIGDFFRLALVF